MRKLIICLSFCFGILYATPTTAQDFYGANFTGRHTWGLNFKYNGDFWVGTHYNVRRFGGFGSRPLDFNIVTELKIDKGIGGLATELSVNQIYADGKDFQPSFGLGAKYGVRAEFCPIMNKEEGNPCTGNFSVNLGLKPGYYAGDYAVAANIETDPVKLYWGEYNDGYKKEAKEDSKVDVRIFERIGVGAHFDYTNVSSGSGKFHITTDYDHDFYIGMQEKVAWDTFYQLNKAEAEADYDSNDGNCTMPVRNFNLKASMALRF